MCSPHTVQLRTTGSWCFSFSLCQLYIHLMVLRQVADSKGLTQKLIFLLLVENRPHYSILAEEYLCPLVMTPEHWCCIESWGQQKIQSTFLTFFSWRRKRLIIPKGITRSALSNLLVNIGRSSLPSHGRSCFVNYSQRMCT